MNRALTSLLLLAAAFATTSCSTQESDGRKYYSNSSPVQGKMGVQFKRVRVPQAEGSTDTAAATTVEDDGSLFGSRLRNDPPGLMDRNEKPDEPGAKYWLHAQQSSTPVLSKMGVRVQRKKKE